MTLRLCCLGVLQLWFCSQKRSVQPFWRYVSVWHCMCVYVCACACVCACMGACMLACMLACMHVCVYVCVHACVCMRVCVLAYISPYMATSVCTCLHEMYYFLLVWNKFVIIYFFDFKCHMHARMHARTHARTHTHARARTHAHTHTHTHTHCIMMFTFVGGENTKAGIQTCRDHFQEVTTNAVPEPYVWGPTS